METYTVTLGNFDLKLGQVSYRPRRSWAQKNKKSKMASQSEPGPDELINGITGALYCQKSEFQQQISNVHKLKDLDETFKALEKVAKAVIVTSTKSVRYTQCWNV